MYADDGVDVATLSYAVGHGLEVFLGGRLVFTSERCVETSDRLGMFIAECVVDLIEKGDHQRVVIGGRHTSAFS